MHEKYCETKANKKDNATKDSKEKMKQLEDKALKCKSNIDELH